ncbi:Rho termination factor N-terminal domain-containing protein [Fenollaria massiliensis]|uniref:Rho termination factor N-terminal domain-containing protein n=1 Tax=Fenollaria massiliensis TaxID=938288 RepID=UPI000362DA73|nr:Rho termination factor N-terminal domain-containing protein [Fenollaria massiliensis]
MIVDNHLDDYKLVELQNFAKNYGLKNFTKLKKLELIEYILKSIRTNHDEDAFKSCKNLDEFFEKLIIIAQTLKKINQKKKKLIQKQLKITL